MISLSLTLTLALTLHSKVPATVWLQLIDEADETASPAVAFEDLPSTVALQQASKFMRVSSLKTDWAAVADASHHQTPYSPSSPRASEV